MCCHHHTFARQNARRNLIKPYRQHPCNDHLQRLGPWQCCSGNSGIHWVVAWMARIVDLNGRRWDVETATPNFDLAIAMFCCCLCLVHALKITIMTLVQPPRVDDRHREVLALCEDGPCSANGSAQDGSEN